VTSLCSRRPGARIAVAPARAGGIAASVAVLAFFIFFCSTPTHAQQAVGITAGASTLFDAKGGSVDFKDRDTAVTVGIGEMQDRFAIGVRLRRVYDNIRFTAGDDIIDFQLPTDSSGGSRYLPLRGLGADFTRRSARYQLFGGAASTTRGAPFFMGAISQRALGLAFVDVPAGKHWRFISRNAVTDKVTAIQSAEWRKDATLAVAASAGVGSNQPYAATSLQVDREQMSARVGYTARTADFRRIDVQSPMAVDTEREDVAITVRPRSWWSVNASRQHFVDPDPQSPAIRRASVDQIGGGVTISGTRFAAALFDAERDGRQNLGLSTSVSRRFERGVDASVDYFRDRSPSSVTQSVSGRVQEPVHPRLSLTQFVTCNDGAWAFNAGGELRSNPVTLGVGYQTTYAPFHPQNPFVRTLAVDLRIHVFGMQLLAGTYVSPDGHLKYTIQGSRYLYRGGDSPDAARRFRMGTYIVRGTVTDESGRGMEGVMVEIDKEIAITDRDGRFFIRADKPRTASLRVRTDEPAAAGMVAAVTAPSRVRFQPESAASAVEIVVHATGPGRQ